MSERRKVTPFELRRRALEMESELNRVQLRGEFHRLRQRMDWLRGFRGMTRGQRATKMLVGLAGASIALGAWRQRGMIRRAVRVAALARPAFGLVRKLARGRSRRL